MSLVTLAARVGFLSPPRRSPAYAEACRLVGLALFSYAAAWAGLRLTREMTGTAAIWIADPFLLAAILRAPLRRWPARLGVGVLAYCGANLTFSSNVTLSALLPLCNGIGILAAAVPLRRRHGTAINVAQSRPLVDFCVFAGLLAPSVSASLATLVLTRLAPLAPLLAWKSWFLADALGIVAIGPLLLGIHLPDLAALAAPSRYRDVLAVAVVVAAASGLAFGQDLYPVPYLFFPALILAAFRTGFAGAVLASVLACTIALALTMTGHGPFASTAILDASDQASLLQLLLAVAVLTTLPVASVLAARDALSRDLLAATQRAEAANQAKSQFLASMSHELRTPLNAVIGFAEMLLLPRAELGERHRHYVEDILRSGNQLLALVTDILDFAQIEKGDLRLLIEPIAVAGLLNELGKTMAPIAAAKGLSFTIDRLRDDVPPVVADRVRLLQILLNLSSNAVKYNRPGGVVRVGATTVPGGPGGPGGPGARIRLAVEDTGIGIPPGRQHELFQPFNRLGAEAGSIEGTGIGLSICLQLAKLMGGAVDFSSSPGRGSVFWVDLPAAAASDRNGDRAR